jgi:hypothetical protein
LAAIVELLRFGKVSPYGLAALIGVAQWFDQLSRPLFAILDTVYAFTRLPRPTVAQELPPSVVRELLLVLALAPLWEADLTRPWLDEVEATDYRHHSASVSVLLAARLILQGASAASPRNAATIPG